MADRIPHAIVHNLTLACLTDTLGEDAQQALESHARDAGCEAGDIIEESREELSRATLRGWNDHEVAAAIERLEGLANV